MAATQTRPSDDPVARSATRPTPDRTVRPRRGLPGGRAVVGGLLVAVAAVGIFAAVSGAGRGPSTEYVVAARTLEPGTVVQADDFETVAVELPGSVAGRSFTNPAQLDGGVLLGALEEGELVQVSDVGDAGDAVPTVSVALDASDGYNGTLLPGDRVDIYVTFGENTRSSTRLIVESALVVESGEADDATIGQAGKVSLTVAVPKVEDRLELINAVHAGRAAVVRITGAETAGVEDEFDPEEVAEESTPPASSTPSTTESDGAGG